MFAYGEDMKFFRCPVCFARELDSILYYDAEEKEFYCKKCCYSGKEAEIQEFFQLHCERKYKEMLDRR